MIKKLLRACCRILPGVVLGLILLLGCWCEARELLNFLPPGASGEQPGNWLDQDQGLQPAAEAYYNETGEQLVACLAGSEGWGTIRSKVMILDVVEVDSLEIEVAALESGAKLVIDLYSRGPNEQIYRCERIFTPGVYQYNLKQILRKAGQIAFGVQLTIEGQKGMKACKAHISRLRIITADNDNVFTADYHESFAGPAGQTPRYWRSGHNNAFITCRKNKSARLVLGPDKNYGDVISPIFDNEGKNKFTAFSLQITGISARTYLDVVLQEEKDSYRDIALFRNIARSGRYLKNIQSILDQHHITRFSIKIWINGLPEQSTAFISAFEMMSEKNPEKTPGQPFIQVAALGIKINEKTVAGKTAAKKDLWQYVFKGKNGAQPEEWWDATNNRDFNTEMTYSDSPPAAEILLGPDNYWGKVLSPRLQCDFAKYPILECAIVAVSPGTSWRLGVQEIGGSQLRHWFLQDQLTDKTGKFVYDCSQLTQLQAGDVFKIEIILENRSYVAQSPLPAARVHKKKEPPLPPETNPDTIVIGVEQRVYEDFGNFQEVQSRVRHLQAGMQKKLALPLKIIGFSNEDLRSAYLRGRVDILLSYEEEYAQFQRPGQLESFLTLARQGAKSQACGLYVHPKSGIHTPENLRGHRLAYSSSTVVAKVTEYFYTNPDPGYQPAFFRELMHENNARNLVLALQLRKTDAIAEYEYIEKIAADLNVHLRCIGKSAAQPHACAYMRVSRNPDKNQAILKLRDLLLHLHDDPGNKEFLDFFGISALVKP
ncbi:PhnD/SsuA/transferrin family substrate-binding protein [candidate division FCPU426 bacterium]|nr:PhnD/SsuA/transferrin family substrate-binding protein [candidate division FCPU426 bacterium]